MAANFDLANMALQATCPNNEILYDDLGMPSVMVRIPKMTYAQLGMGDSNAVHPAFIINGTEIPEIYISKYQNIVQNSRAYSLPGVAPKTNITFDAARQACERKGEGWHVMTRMEWGMLVRWCQMNGVMPKGNNNYGKHSSENVYKAIPANKDADHYAIRTMTGTGPLTWYHNQEADGIADLCGNVWEWSGAMRSVFGELQILANNNGSDSAKSQRATSTEWKAIRASDGALITPNGSGTTSGSIKMDWVNSTLTFSNTITDSAPGTHSCTFANIVCNASIGSDAKLLLQTLGLLMYGEEAELFSAQSAYFNNADEERLFFSGGNYGISTCGLASFSGSHPRSYDSDSIGFRSAFVRLPTA